MSVFYDVTPSDGIKVISNDSDWHHLISVFPWCSRTKRVRNHGGSWPQIDYQADFRVWNPPRGLYQKADCYSTWLAALKHECIRVCFAIWLYASRLNEVLFRHSIRHRYIAMKQKLVVLSEIVVLRERIFVLMRPQLHKVHSRWCTVCCPSYRLQMHIHNAVISTRLYIYYSNSVY